MEGSTPRIMSKKQSGMTASQSSIANALSQIGIEPLGKVTPNINQREREERGRIVREKQTEDRAKKLDELKQQAMATQKYREQKEAERRQRIDDMRLKDSERRTLVEERRRVLWEAEQEKRDAILRKAQEREQRLQAKRRNERSSIVFAFGSSTPRMLEPVSSTSFWGRRAASTMNVGYSGAPLTRRMSERELNLDSNYKKQRATSAHALHRKIEDSGSASVPLSRPQSAISNQSDDKHPTVIHRPRSSLRPRPNSIAVSGINLSIAVSKELKNIDCKSPEPKTPTSASRSNSASRPPSKSTVKKTNPPAKRDVTSVPTTPSETKKSLPAAKPAKPIQKTAKDTPSGGSSNHASSKASPEPEEVQPIKNFPEAEQQQEVEQQAEEQIDNPSAEAENGKEELPECDMTSSFTTRRIASEEEAKAALTERRRVMREQQEKEAQIAEEMKKLQLQKEEEARQKKREEKERRREEMARQQELRRQEEQKRQEEEEQRLREEEAKEVEARRIEEEERLAMEKEQEKKALEEAEKQRQELAERLRKEEEERQARRKRVEMIMSRTRKQGGNSTVSKEDSEETEGRVSPSDNVESANTINNIKEVLDKSVCQPTSDIIMGDVMLVNSTSQETNGHNKIE